MKTYVIKKQGGGDFQVDYAKELNPEQLEVVMNGDGACLVLAGAGSGKTRTIVYRVAYLVERGVPSERILLLTFTNKAAREMLSRVQTLVGLDASRLWGGTFHHVCHRILRESVERSGLRPGFTILDAEDAKDLMKVCVRDEGIDPKAKRFPSPAVLLEILSYAQNSRLALPEAIEIKHPSFRELEEQIERVLSRYVERKRSSNAVDFDDLLLLTLKLFERNPDTLARYAERFRYVLVDEYQDTNPLQAALVRLLSSAHGNILVVGDDAQAIYSFRGADIRNILSFPKEHKDARTFRLETNYRSTPEILDVANDVISKNANQFPKELKSVRPSFAKPAAVSASSASQEAEYVAQRILELRDEGVPLREIAVLFRATFHSQALEFELMKRGIPYDYRGGLKFFDRAHVKDVLAFLRIIVNKDDVVAWTRALSLQVGVGGVTASRLYDRVRATGAIEDVDEALGEGLPARASAGWSAFLDVFRPLLAARPSPGAMLRVIADSDYRQHLENEYPDFRDRIGDLEELAAFADAYDDPEKFLSDVTLRDDLAAGRAGRRRETAAADDERLVLSTIHQAKGLEWDAVFVIHLSQGAFPNKRASLDDGGLEEERRLFYVAITRARRELALSYPMMLGRGEFAFEPKSVFLEELDPRLVEETRIEESYDDLPTISLDGDGERPPRKGLLRDIGEY